MLITNKRSYGSLFFLLKSLFLAVRGNIESLGVALIFLYLFYYLPISVFSLVFFVYPPSVSINPLPPATTRLIGTPIPSPLWRFVITHPDFDSATMLQFDATFFCHVTQCMMTSPRPPDLARSDEGQFKDPMEEWNEATFWLPMTISTLESVIHVRSGVEPTFLPCLVGKPGSRS